GTRTATTRTPSRPTAKAPTASATRRTTAATSPPAATTRPGSTCCSATAPSTSSTTASSSRPGRRSARAAAAKWSMRRSSNEGAGETSVTNITRRDLVRRLAGTAGAVFLGAGGSWALAAPEDQEWSFPLLGDLHIDHPDHHDMDWLAKEHPNDVSQVRNYC